MGLLNVGASNVTRLAGRNEQTPRRRSNQRNVVVHL